MSLVNACELNKATKVVKDQKKINQLTDLAEKSSTRSFKKILDIEMGRQRREVLVLKDYMMDKFDRLRKKYGDLSTLELIEIMLEKELKHPGQMQRERKNIKGLSRSLSKAVKAKVYTGECANCGVKHGLEYDHKVKFSHGGKNTTSNIQVLCRGCNQRKEIKSRQSGLFV